MICYLYSTAQLKLDIRMSLSEATPKYACKLVASA